MAALMDETTLSRPSFYQYFPDIHALLESLLEDVRAALLARANPWIVGEGDPRSALLEALRGVVEVGAAHGTTIRAIHDAAPYDARLERAWATFMGSWDKAVAARIEAQQSEGLVPRAIDARAMAHSLNALNAVAIVDAFGRRPHPSQEGLVDTLHRIWTGSLYAPPPPVGARPRESKKKSAPRPRRGGGQGDG